MENYQHIHISTMYTAVKWSNYNSSKQQLVDTLLYVQSPFYSLFFIFYIQIVFRIFPSYEQFVLIDDDY